MLAVRKDNNNLNRVLQVGLGEEVTARALAQSSFGHVEAVRVSLRLQSAHLKR